MRSETDACSSGLGVCTPSHVLVIRPAAATLELGAYPDLLNGVFGAVHRVNRRMASDARVAICLPDAKNGKGMMSIGERIVLMGSDALLRSVLEDDDLSRLRARGMFAGRVREHDVSDVETGSVLSRSRQIEKHLLDGAAARRARRAVRRAEHILLSAGTHQKAPKPGIPSRTSGFVILKPGLRIDLISGRSAWEGREILVTTYGLSPMSRPAVLPFDGCAQ